MQIAAPLPRPVRRFLPAGNLRPGRKQVLALLAVVALAAAGVYAYQRVFSQQAPAPLGQVVPVQRGNVAATVAATGSVVATKQAKLVFTGSGKIKDILVNIGDQVSANQTLAHLVIDAAQVKLETAKSQLLTAQFKLQQQTESATPEDLAAAQSAYDAAMAKLDDVQAGPKTADLQSAQAAVLQAQATLADATNKLQVLTSGGTAPDRTTAQAALTTAENALATAQAKLDDLNAGPTNVDLTTARTAVSDAESGLRSAQQKLEDAKAGSTTSELAAAQSTFDTAQASVTNARVKLDQVTSTSDLSPEIITARQGLAAAELKLHQSHEALDQLTAQLAQANAEVASQQVGLAAALKSADQTCDKLGDSSADCSSAKAKIDALQPTILKAEQQVKLLSGSGAWDQLAAQKDVTAAQLAYDLAAAKLKQ
ncbi:MAG TPA: hypothetical protein VFG86_02010, partial [Chloroflexota bacterium]|nr:hypothetical protein [Chloroflexota bacterium]